VLHVLYLIFNEGYTAAPGASGDDSASQVELTAEAIRLARELYRLRPEDTEISGLLALMLLTEARRPARLTSGGDLVDLADQDRALWNRSLIDEGVDLITDALAAGSLGAYQLQAAIAAVHDEAACAQDTDWPQILALYLMLDHVAPNPMATLSFAVAVAHVRGPQAGLEVLGTLADDARVAGQHRMYAVRGHLLEMAGDRAAAREAFQGAMRRTASSAEKRYLRKRIDRL
jgi:predicted RNA polymerase sigma factor